MNFTLFYTTSFLLFTATCTDISKEADTDKMEKDTNFKHTNQLINETSPYLLQHAHNPVNWYPWGDEALQKAKDENKIIIISIGYSACHWCHVMEHESFEDDEVAQIMNENFISVKVDREERPDVDQVYMDAVHLMGQRGGWPLNVFALPNGKPFYGGTYFPKEQWIDLLQKVQQEYTSNPGKVEEYANKLAEGIQQVSLIHMKSEEADFNMETLNSAVKKWEQSFDEKEGGADRAPKFPLPNSWEFLLQYYYHTGNDKYLKQVQLTLDKMAFGGIYDHLGGGFARYSTDKFWKVPHFEKMLYDNAQLVSLYAQAYQHTKKPLYKKVIEETLEFVKREMTSTEGAFYSALDADSEGEEGKYYVWKKEELKEILNENYELFAKYYNINSKGVWEHGNYILLRNETDEEIAKSENISVSELNREIEAAKRKLMKVREKRIRPGLDDKTLTSWNALMVKGYIDAYNTLEEKSYLHAAEKNALFIVEKQLRKDGGLNHTYKNGESRINGYLEDYCFTIEAFVALYQATFDVAWLNRAKELTDYTILHFFDENSGMFWFTSDEDRQLIARKIEYSDNVIPASNSSMAKALFILGHYFYEKDYLTKAEQMLKNIQNEIAEYAPGYSNWGILMLNFVNTYYEVAICGKNAMELRKGIFEHYIPNKLVAGSLKEENLPLLENKFSEDQTRIFVCINKACKMPVDNVKAAIKQMSE